MADDAVPPHSEPSQPRSAAGCFVRAGWLLGGFMLLTPLAILIARGRRWTWTAKDVAFFLILALVVALRFIDWKRFDATNAIGEPATLRDMCRYAVWIVGGWSALWVLAQTLEMG